MVSLGYGEYRESCMWGMLNVGYVECRVSM